MPGIRIPKGGPKQSTSLRRFRWRRPYHGTLVSFTPAELEFLASQRLARVATVGSSGWPHVMPVVFALDPDGAISFDVDGVKLRNIKTEPRIALVIDAFGPKRGVAVQGRAALVGPERARMVPQRKFTWGL